MANLTKLSESKVFGGQWLRYKHDSTTVNTPMEFSVFLPPKAVTEPKEKVKAVLWLSGLTCTDQNFMQKAGAQRVAAEVQLALVVPDTSPRTSPENRLPGETDHWDFGAGAGFYVDATHDPWSKYYHMYSYVVKELPQLVAANFPILTEPGCLGIMGHSMGGHGALICALKNPGMYRSLSVFAPVCNPSACPWGIKAFTHYLGSDKFKWKAYDATELVKKYSGPNLEILISQGTLDNFLAEQLRPEAFVEAARGNSKVAVELRMEEGYDHSYNFIATFIEQHLRHHARLLSTPATG
eukprot:RCo050278